MTYSDKILSYIVGRTTYSDKILSYIVGRTTYSDKILDYIVSRMTYSTKKSRYIDRILYPAIKILQIKKGLVLKLILFLVVVDLSFNCFGNKEVKFGISK